MNQKKNTMEIRKYFELNNKNTFQGRSQDGVLGGLGIHVSSQLGHLPGTGEGPQTPKGTGRTPSDQVGHGAWEE